MARRDSSAISTIEHRVLLRQRAGHDKATLTMQDRRSHAFTLIELLVVITIIVVLMGLLFPAFRGVQDQAKRTQAKNDLTQIVTAVNAYFTEYGKYPLPAGATNDTIYGAGVPNVAVLSELRGLSGSPLNPKQIAFISPPDVKDPAHPRGGIGGTADRPGEYFDPWGTPYLIEIDGDYEGKVRNPYTANAGAPDLQLGIIAWSLGKDQDGAKALDAGDKKTGIYDDDVISWQ
jgi:prepilin-type N-terminal cleavage/methylation domain-containing protein